MISSLTFYNHTCPHWAQRNNFTSHETPQIPWNRDPHRRVWRGITALTNVWTVHLQKYASSCARISTSFKTRRNGRRRLLSQTRHTAQINPVNKITFPVERGTFRTDFNSAYASHSLICVVFQRLFYSLLHCTLTFYHRPFCRDLFRYLDYRRKLNLQVACIMMCVLFPQYTHRVVWK